LHATPAYCHQCLNRRGASFEPAFAWRLKRLRLPSYRSRTHMRAKIARTTYTVYATRKYLSNVVTCAMFPASPTVELASPQTLVGDILLQKSRQRERQTTGPRRMMPPCQGVRALRADQYASMTPATTIGLAAMNLSSAAVNRRHAPSGWRASIAAGCSRRKAARTRNPEHLSFADRRVESRLGSRGAIRGPRRLAARRRC
jgi:hypothetical protein